MYIYIYILAGQPALRAGFPASSCGKHMVHGLRMCSISKNSCPASNIEVIFG